MAKPLLPDELWEMIPPLLPAPKPRRFRYPGRKPIGDREALTGILFVLKTGIPWEYLPAEMGCGCGMSCWRRLRDWQAAGVWYALYQLLLTKLDNVGKIDWSRAAVDGTFARAFGGVEGSGPNPTDRGRPGIKQHLLVDVDGVPVAGVKTAANVAEVTQLVPLVDAAGPRLPEGGPVHRPQNRYADRGYDSEPHRELLRERGIDPHLAKRAEHGSGLGVFRWVVERTAGRVPCMDSIGVQRKKAPARRSARGLNTFHFCSVPADVNPFVTSIGTLQNAQPSFTIDR